ncbi:MAG: Fe-S protein assembly co-chaperone HscB [Moraxella sp.]|nr:Fe-S protein assembly co-chaperone HscB [Moraxella sp.]
MKQNDFFALFGLPATFDIDKTVLKERFLALQKQHHPDNFLGDEVKQAEQNTALINHAYTTLNRNDSRAVYLLEHMGVAFNSDKSIGDEPFLMQMMQFRMDLEDAILDKDHARIQAIAQSVSELNALTAKAFHQTFNDKQWDNAQTIAQKMKFLANLYDDINNALSQTALSGDTDNDDDLYV